jgi:hypothetical protein
MRIFSIVIMLLLFACFYPISISANDLQNQHYKQIESSDSSVTSVSGQWIIVMHDPRSKRRKQRATGIAYASKGTYDADPKLEVYLVNLLKIISCRWLCSGQSRI